MRAVAQRVISARVEVDGEVVGAIDHGLLVYLGTERGDSASDEDYLATKLGGLRIFGDEAGRMSRSVADVGGAILVVPQFTLFGDVRSGRRPSFDGAAPPDEAERIYEVMLERLARSGVRVARGRFRADMRVNCVVDGPVTILLDSRKLF
jgi:D-tyrosyl-tRNA(Tyr) deacylase